MKSRIEPSASPFGIVKSGIELVKKTYDDILECWWT